MTPIPRVIAACAVLVTTASLCASDALAWQSHYLRAQAGNSFQVESTSTPSETSVEKLNQTGVAGVDDYVFFARAMVDSDSGVLLAENLIDSGAGGSASTNDAVAQLEQYLDFAPTSGPVTVSWHLHFDASTQVAGGVALAQVEGRIDVGPLCGVLVEVSFGADPDVVNDCEIEQFPYVDIVSSAGAGAMSITATWHAGHVPSGVDFLVQVSNHLQIYSGVEPVVSAFGSGGFSMTVAAPDGYAFTSPTFLTVPEPSSFAAGALALGLLLGASARRAPGPRAASPQH
ncbi:MAG: hypothetical protein DCC71_00680 [Proteobacteria bacterium]|nr:MAG: hypothetical protein DCC71_00680 [Pseudomonadota bacterium]